VPGYEIALRDKDGREVGDDEEGILWCAAIPTRRCTGTGRTRRGNHPRRRVDLHRRSFRARRRRLSLLPRRADDLIKISGQWVYPLEVELCLAEHPQVRECAVFAAELPDRRMTLKAVVVMNDAPSIKAARPECCRISSRQNAALQIFRARSLVHRGVAEDRTGKMTRQALLRV